MGQMYDCCKVMVKMCFAVGTLMSCSSVSETLVSSLSCMNCKDFSVVVGQKIQIEEKRHLFFFQATNYPCVSTVCRRDCKSTCSLLKARSNVKWIIYEVSGIIIKNLNEPKIILQYDIAIKLLQCSIAFQLVEKLNIFSVNIQYSYVLKQT